MDINELLARIKGMVSPAGVGTAINLGYCPPEDLGWIEIGVLDQFGSPDASQINTDLVGYQYMQWQGIPVGWFWKREYVDVALLINLRTGDVVFVVLAETEEQAQKWLKITNGHMDYPREDCVAVWEAFESLLFRKALQNLVA